MMNETKTCPKCGAPLPENAPAGICPTCLLQAGLASAGDAGSSPDIKQATLASGFVPPAPEELARHFPQLEILELIGKGGMGAVYKARQPGLDRLVALKVLPPEIGRDPSFAERFTREARALARLSHNHIVSVYDFGQTSAPLAPLGTGVGGEGSLFFIVMEFVDGLNLRQTIESGGLSPADAMTIVPQICEALQFAHDEGIVHRDIKPENILIDKKGRVKIADFGLAKLLASGGRESPGPALTATRQVMGTLRYMAPEQMHGSREVDHRADIYSLGVVFYELLTGELPMGRFAPPSQRVQVDVRLDEIVLRALEQQPEQRYQHASEVKTDVDAIVQSGAASSRSQRGGPTGTVTLAARWGPRDATGWLIRIVNTLLPPAISYSVWVAGIYLLIFASGEQGQLALQRKPGLITYTLVVLGLVAVFVTIAIYVFNMQRVVRSLTLSAKGVTMQFGSRPSRFFAWDEIAGLSVFREQWWGWGIRRGDKLAGSPATLARDAFGIDSCRGCRRYFLPEDRRAFAAAISRFAPPDAAWAEALRAESESESMRARSIANSERATLPRHSAPPNHPPLVLVLATIDLFAAVALLLLLYNATPYPESVSRFWHRWSQVEIALGYLAGAGLFVASVALLLWKPWARKLILGVCFLFMSQWVIALPDLTQMAFPLALDEVREQALSQGHPAEEAERAASLATLVFGGLFVVGLTWLIGHLVYFTRPRVVAAFRSQDELQPQGIGPKEKQPTAR